MARSQADDEVRARAEVTDDGEILPPTVDVQDADVPAAVVDAINEALAAEPSTVIDALVSSVDDGRAVARFAGNWQEMPALGDDGELLGWKAPYQSRERFEAALSDALDGYRFEPKNAHQTDIYAEGGR